MTSATASAAVARPGAAPQRPAAHATTPKLTRSQAAIQACAHSAFVNIAGQGPLCASNGTWVMRFGKRVKTVSAPDLVSVVARSPAPARNVAAAALPAQQCVDPAHHTHVELYYAHFSDQPDNFAGHAADIQQMFLNVDGSFLNYDAATWFGVGVHMFAECDGSGNPVVHDIGLSTPLGSSNFASIANDMANQGHNNNLAHYWVWTDGNPLAAFGYAGQSTIEEDDSPGAGNLINGSYQYSVNYGFTAAQNGSQIFAHENGHAMGAVQLSAPDSTGLWHCTDGYDVMCYNDGGPRGSSYSNTHCAAAPNGTLLFDCGFNDYFNPGPAAGSYLATHWNLASASNHWVYLQPATSSTGLTVSTASAVYSQPVTLTATVHGPGAPQPGTPGGSVTFSDGGSALATAALDASGTATFTTTSLAQGYHSISAAYGGSGVYLASNSSSAGVTVTPAASTTSVSTSANPAPLNASISVTATVSPVSPATAAPTGSVTILDGATQLGTATLDGNGNASITASLSYGAHQLHATYPGDANFSGSDDSGSPLTETVLFPTSTSLSSSANQATGEVGTQVTFNATVTVGAGTPNGQAPPSGSITFKDGSTAISGALPLDSSLHASYSTSSLTPGMHQIHAVYSGDTAFVPSTGTLNETVTAFASMYEMDGFGGLHAVASPSISDVPASWPGWKIARGVAMRADGHSGYVLDGWGGVHPFGGAPAVSTTGYWGGWDIARAIALRADGVSGYVLDGWGGIHPFGGAPAVKGAPFWGGWDIARGFVLRSDGVSGYVLDGWGGVHPFGGAPALKGAPVWGGWDIARSIVLDPDGAGGYVLDGWGGVHQFGNAPSVKTTAFWSGWDIARNIVLIPGGLHMGYVLDGWGALHAFGGAPQLNVPASALFPGKDVGRCVAVE